MSRMIDADLLGLTDMEIIMCDGDYKEALKMLIDKIEHAPTIEPERKVGKWICSDDMYETAVCSVCKWDTAEPWGHIKLWFKFCPHCGAKMDTCKSQTAGATN